MRISSIAIFLYLLVVLHFVEGKENKKKEKSEGAAGKQEKNAKGTSNAGKESSEGSSSSSSFVLDERIMKLTKISGELSALSFEEDPSIGADEYDSFVYWEDEPDQTIVASKMGYCFAAFRGTTWTWPDWSQNLNLRYDKVCGMKDGKEECCTTREGFNGAYETDFRADMEAALRDCASGCKDKQECIVLSGFSQGGAIAAVAALHFADLNPYVITTGQPPAIDSPCNLINSERYYRYINTKESNRLTVGVEYDPVCFVPSVHADSFGHMIILSGDSTGVAYIGMDVQDTFGPLDLNGFQSHSMRANGSPHPGYLDRIDALMQNGKYPIRTTGFAPGTLCTENNECDSRDCRRETGFSWKRCFGSGCKDNSECPSGRCDTGVCVPKLGSCGVCDEHSDCASGHCTWKFRCRNMQGLVDNGCLCNWSHECASGRCEGITSPVCLARLGPGSRCNEDFDCLSDKCSWRFRCN